MNIIYVTQHYYPEIGAASSRATELTKYFQLNNIKIKILTSVPNYPFKKIYYGYKNKNIIENFNEGIKVYRSRINLSEKQNKFERLKNYFSFWENSKVFFKNIVDGDVVIGTIGPIPVSDIAYKISKKYKIPFILEIRDLTYKQVLATNYGSRLIANTIRKYELHYSKKADLIVTVTEGYKKDLIENGINNKKIYVIRNGFDFENSKNEIKNNGLYTSILEKLKKFKIKFGYFGTLGVSQDVLNIVKNFNNNMSLLIFGEGVQYKKIENYIKENNLKNIFLYKSIPEKELIPYYSMVDYNLVILKKDKEFNYTIPSKIFKIMGYKSLPVFIGPFGEAATIIKEIDERLCIKILSDLKKLERITDDEKEKLQKKSYDLCYEKYNREKQAKKYIDIIKNLVEVKKK